MAPSAPASPDLPSTDAALEAALASVCDAGRGRGLLDLGWIRRVRRRSPRAILELALPRFAASQQARIVEEVRLKQMLIEGFCSVAAGSNPRRVERRMRSHLSVPPPPEGAIGARVGR